MLQLFESTEHFGPDVRSKMIGSGFVQWESTLSLSAPVASDEASAITEAAQYEPDSDDGAENEDDFPLYPPTSQVDSAGNAAASAEAMHMQMADSMGDGVGDVRHPSLIRSHPSLLSTPTVTPLSWSPTPTHRYPNTINLHITPTLRSSASGVLHRWQSFVR